MSASTGYAFSATSAENLAFQPAPLAPAAAQVAETTLTRSKSPVMTPPAPSTGSGHRSPLQPAQLSSSVSSSARFTMNSHSPVAPLATFFIVPNPLGFSPSAPATLSAAAAASVQPQPVASSPDRAAAPQTPHRHAATPSAAVFASGGGGASRLLPATPRRIPGTPTHAACATLHSGATTSRGLLSSPVHIAAAAAATDAAGSGHAGGAFPSTPRRAHATPGGFMSPSQSISAAQHGLGSPRRLPQASLAAPMSPSGARSASSVITAAGGAAGMGPAPAPTAAAMVSMAMPSMSASGLCAAAGVTGSGGGGGGGLAAGAMGPRSPLGMGSPRRLLSASPFHSTTTSSSSSSSAASLISCSSFSSSSLSAAGAAMGSPRAAAAATAAATTAAAPPGTPSAGARGGAAGGGNGLGLGLLLSPSKSAAAGGSVYSRYASENTTVVGTQQMLLTASHAAAGLVQAGAVRRIKDCGAAFTSLGALASAGGALHSPMGSVHSHFFAHGGPLASPHAAAAHTTSAHATDVQRGVPAYYVAPGQSPFRGPRSGAAAATAAAGTATTAGARSVQGAMTVGEMLQMQSATTATPPTAAPGVLTGRPGFKSPRQPVFSDDSDSDDECDTRAGDARPCVMCDATDNSDADQNDDDNDDYEGDGDENELSAGARAATTSAFLASLASAAPIVALPGALTADDVADAVGDNDCSDFNVGAAAADFVRNASRTARGEYESTSSSSLGRAFQSLLPRAETGEPRDAEGFTGSGIVSAYDATGRPWMPTTDLSGGATPAEADYYAFVRQASADATLFARYESETLPALDPAAAAGGLMAHSVSADEGASLFGLASMIRAAGSDYGAAHAPTPVVDILKTSLRRGREVLERRAEEIPAIPERILEAPMLRDDFYNHTLDWSSKNVVSVALNDKIYNLDYVTQDVAPMLSINEDDTPRDQRRSIASVKWNEAGDRVAVGLCSGEIIIMDDEHNLLKTYTLCSKRVSTLSWAGSILTAGGKDTFVHLIDIRTRGRFNEAASFDAGAVSAGLAPPSLQTSSGRVLRLPEAGLRETCGLSWSDGARSLAVGSNNNRCLVWDAANLSRPRLCFTESRAAIKSLAWCPFNPELLVTGAGTTDRCLRYYNTTSGSLLSTVNTGSQVSSVHWSRSHQELVTTHGFLSNCATVWQFPSMRAITTLNGHKERIITSALSPDGSTLCSASADETLRFWRIWDPLTPSTTLSLSSSNSSAAASSDVRGRVSVAAAAAAAAALPGGGSALGAKAAAGGMRARTGELATFSGTEADAELKRLYSTARPGLGHENTSSLSGLR